MKNAIMKFVDGMTTFLSYNITDSRKTFYELEKMNYKESAEYIHKKGASALLVDKKDSFWKHAINQIPTKGAILEFGVFQGTSINFFSSVLKSNNDVRKIYGFDSFEGLSEDWVGTHMSSSTFNLHGKLPKVGENVSLIKGWVDETLPPFIEKNINSEEKIAFLHMDLDTYTPTKVVFDLTVDLLKPGTIVVFDELLGYPGWKDGEYKALIEAIDPKWEYQFISFCEPKFKNRHRSKYVRAALKIIKSKK